MNWRAHPLLLLIALLPACRSWDGPTPFRVVEVLAPDELRVQLPHGPETIHLQYVAAPPRGSAEWSRGIAFVTTFTQSGVGLRLQPAFPLLRNNKGQLECVVRGFEAPEDRSPPSLNAELLRHGLSSLSPDPAGETYAELYQCEQAAIAAMKARRGVYSVLDPATVDAVPADPGERFNQAIRELAKPPQATPTEPVSLPAAQAALARATGILRTHGGVELPAQQLVLLDAEGFAKRLMGDQPLDPLSARFVAVAAAYAPRGTEIVLRDALPPLALEPDRLCLLLLHELIHKVQYELGLVVDGLPAPTEDETRRYWGEGDAPVQDAQGNWSMERRPWLAMTDVQRWLPEGHAHVWTGRLAQAAGLGATYDGHRFGLDLLRTGLPYWEGAAFWRWVYARLEAAGEQPTLKRGASPLLDRVHAALLGPGRPRAPHDLVAPDPWLAAHVEGFPPPPWRLELAGTFRGRERDPSQYGPDDLYAEWRLTCSRPLFVQLESNLVHAEGWKGDKWAWRPPQESSGEQVRFLLEPGQERLLPILLTTNDRPLAGRHRLKGLLKGLLISYPEGGGAPLVFGHLATPWIERTFEQ